MTIEERTKLSEMKRQSILDAAIEEFQKSGYAMTSTDRIAHRAKVSKRTVYNHFENKEALFKAILSSLMKIACAAHTMNYEPSKTLEQQLEKFIKIQIEYFNKAETLKLARLVLVEMIRSPKNSAEAFKELRDTDNGLKNWLNQAKKNGQLSFANTMDVTTQLMGMIKTIAFWPQILENAKVLSSKERERQAKQISSMFLGFYKTTKLS